MSGIYIHIPFCKQACNYCDFHFSTSLKSKEGFINALLKEIELQKNYLHESRSPLGRVREGLSSVYFGGGTPSLLSTDEINSVFFTGGSTQIPFIRAAILHHFPHAENVQGDVFSSVGKGLIIDAKHKFA